MKKIAICAVALMAAVAAFAELSLSSEAVITKGAKGETTGYPERYTGYLCTQAKAAELFGGNTTVDGITGYLAENYVDYANGGMTAVDFYGYLDDEYTFQNYVKPGSLVEGGNYIAVVAYAGGEGEDDMFRVFESMASGGVLEFDPASGGGTAGAWTTAAMPEPTSGLLFLLGLASLALRRKRGEG